MTELKEVASGSCLSWILDPGEMGCVCTLADAKKQNRAERVL